MVSGKLSNMYMYTYSSMQRLKQEEFTLVLAGDEFSLIMIHSLICRL